MLKTRVLTATVLLIAVVAALFLLPRLAWIAVAAILLAQAAWEWGGLARLRQGPRALYTVALVAALLLLHLDDYPPLLRWAYYAAAAFWIVAAPIWLWRRPAFHSSGVLAAGVLALLPAVSALIVLRDRGPVLLLIVMTAIWISDTAAMFAGRRFGKHKLAPEISPAKTWEGVIGAYAAVALYGFGIAWLAGAAIFPKDATWSPERVVLWLLLLALLVAAGIVGDLFESQMKRAAGVKDSGGLLPGHGGLLDRIDSQTAALPIAVLALSFAR
jgi:phosphatidate cytidylyltransferase